MSQVKKGLAHDYSVKGDCKKSLQPSGPVMNILNKRKALVLPGIYFGFA
jgi:hypothetical protein